MWIWLSELGNSKWLLPAAVLLIVLSGISGTLPWRTATRWAIAVGVTSLIVLCSKIAFMGWGIGSAALDFTGFSGHAAMSACVYPPLAALLGTGRHVSRRWLVVAGLALAAAIAYSRLPLWAHSPSEVIAGFLLGGLAAAWPLSRWPARAAALPAWKWLAPAVLALGIQTLLPPTASTHQLVIALAKSVSGRDEIYSRDWLHRRAPRGEEKPTSIAVQQETKND